MVSGSYSKAWEYCCAKNEGDHRNKNLSTSRRTNIEYARLRSTECFEDTFAVQLRKERWLSIYLVGTVLVLQFHTVFVTRHARTFIGNAIGLIHHSGEKACAIRTYIFEYRLLANVLSNDEVLCQIVRIAACQIGLSLPRPLV